MRKICLSKFSTWLWVVIAFGPCLLPQPAEAATTVQFTLVRSYLIVIPVRINDVTTAEFLLDTGTNTTLLHTEFARQLELQTQDRIELVTAAGTQIVPRAFLPSLSCGEKTARNLEVLASDLRTIRTILPNVRGVLGQNFLTQSNYLVDYPNRRISWPEAVAMEGCGTALPFKLKDGRMVVTTESGWRLLLDSAIADLLLFEETVRQNQLDLVPDSLRPMQLHSDAGHAPAWQGTLRRLRLGNLTWQNLPLTLLMQKQTGRLEDGLLPMSLFRAVYVDHLQHRLRLNP